MTKMKKVLTAALAGLLTSAALAVPAQAAYTMCGPSRPCTPVPCPSGLMPNVVGLTAGDAVAAVEGSGFNNWAIVLYTGPTGYASGTVNSTNPLAGNLYPKCNQVLISVVN